MLLRKSWRDIRIAFFVGLGWLALQATGGLWILLRSTAAFPGIIASPDEALSMVGLFIGAQTFVFTLIAFAIGTLGVGRDIGAGSGSFVLTRPVPRGYFVWTEWFSGLIALIVLLLLAVLDLWIIIRCHAFRVFYFTNSGGSSTPHAWTLASLPVRIAAIDALCAFLFVALVFGITHLGTAAFRHSTAGLLFSLSFFAAWLVVTTFLRFKFPWMAPHTPDLLLRPFGPVHMRLIPHATSSILERLAILPLFPLLAHLFLRRTEV